MSKKEKHVPAKQDTQTWTHGNMYFIDWEVVIYDQLFICIRDHVANIFATDLHDGYWKLLDYSDEVTEEQKAILDRYYAPLEMHRWRAIFEPAF